MNKSIFINYLLFLVLNILCVNVVADDDFFEKVKRFDSSISKSEIEKVFDGGLYKIGKDDNSVIYTDSNVEYIFVGRVFNIKGSVVLDQEKVSKSKKNKDFFEKNKDFFISYKKEGNEKNVYALMDYTCPYCYKFHEDVRDIVENNNVNIHFLPISRNPKNADVIFGLMSIWCSSEPQKELKNAFKTQIAKKNSCKKIDEYKTLLKDIYKMADFNNVKGTPAIFSESGYLFDGGYSGKLDFLNKLGKYN